MAYDPRPDAFGALTLGGVGALGGLGYSLLRKKQRNNKLRNALIGATVLPGAYIGGKYLASKFIPGLDEKTLDAYDPIAYVADTANSRIFKMRKRPLIAAESKAHNDWYSDFTRLDKEIPWDDPNRGNLWKENDAKFNEYLEARKAAYPEWEQFRNEVALLGYGTLGAGIGLPALYLAHLNRKKKKKQQERLA